MTAWYYPGQPEVRDMVTCASVRLAIAQNSTMAHSDQSQNLTAHMLEHNLTVTAHGNASQPIGGNIASPVGGNISQPMSAMPHQNTLNKRLSRLVKRYRVDGNADV